MLDKDRSVRKVYLEVFEFSEIFMTHVKNARRDQRNIWVDASNLLHSHLVAFFELSPVKKDMHLSEKDLEIMAGSLKKWQKINVRSRPLNPSPCVRKLNVASIFLSAGYL